MNRLYWLNANGDWELVVEDLHEWPVQAYIQDHIPSIEAGTFAYAKYPAAPDFMRWTQYIRYAGGVRRDSVWDVPKPIQLLEMLQ